MNSEYLDNLVLQGNLFMERFFEYEAESRKEKVNIFKMGWDKYKIMELQEWVKQVFQQLYFSKNTAHQLSCPLCVVNYF